MKSIILAAGYGTRLGTLTQNTAKPLLTVGKKTILDHIVEKVQLLSQISQTYIITNQKYYHDFEQWKHQRKYSNIKIINDHTLTNENRLGSIGDINFVIQQEKINDDILIIGGDNLFEDDLHHFIQFFNTTKTSSIMLHDVKSVTLAKTLGIASINN